MEIIWDYNSGSYFYVQLVDEVGQQPQVKLAFLDVAVVMETKTLNYMEF